MEGFHDEGIEIVDEGFLVFDFIALKKHRLFVKEVSAFFDLFLVGQFADRLEQRMLRVDLKDFHGLRLAPFRSVRLLVEHPFHVHG